MRPAHHDRLAAAAAHRRRARAAQAAAAHARSRPSSSATRSSPTRRRRKFEEDNELDLSFGVKNLCALPRQHLHAARRGRRGAFRTIPFKILHASTSWACRRWSRSCRNKPRGLVLVTGPDRLGQATTLASIIDKINTERARAHHDDRGSDRVPAPAQELRREPARGRRRHRSRSRTRSSTILRQDPDVVLVGEMRDLETIEAALTIAETGHLVLRARCTPTSACRPSTASSTSSRRTSSRRSARSSRSCSRA